MKTSCERTRLPGRPKDDEYRAIRRMIEQDLQPDPITRQTIEMPDPHCHICGYPGSLLRLMMTGERPVLVCPHCEGT